MTSVSCLVEPLELTRRPRRLSIETAARSMTHREHRGARSGSRVLPTPTTRSRHRPLHEDHATTPADRPSPGDHAAGGADRALALRGGGVFDCRPRVRAGRAVRRSGPARAERARRLECSGAARAVLALLLAPPGARVLLRPQRGRQPLRRADGRGRAGRGVHQRGRRRRHPAARPPAWRSLADDVGGAAAHRCTWSRSNRSRSTSGTRARRCSRSRSSCCSRGRWPPGTGGWLRGSSSSARSRCRRTSVSLPVSRWRSPSPSWSRCGASGDGAHRSRRTSGGRCGG